MRHDDGPGEGAARHFGISLNAVKFHLRKLYDKLDVKTRTQAVALFYAPRPDGSG